LKLASNLRPWASGYANLLFAERRLAEALRDAWRKRKVTMADLDRFAKIDRVTNVMRPYLEMLT
jgi:hypothetical protein